MSHQNDTEAVARGGQKMSTVSDYSKEDMPTNKPKL